MSDATMGEPSNRDKGCICPDLYGMNLPCPVHDVRSPEGPAPSEAGTPEREMIATLLQMVRHHPFDHDTVRQERACDLCKTLEKAKALLRGRAAVGNPAPPPNPLAGTIAGSLGMTDVSNVPPELLAPAPPEAREISSELGAVFLARWERDNPRSTMERLRFLQEFAIGIEAAALRRVPPGRDTPTGGNT